MPRVGFENCLVRGRGRLLWVPSSRPFELDVTNAVAALDGPLLEIDPAARAPDDARSRVRLRRLTALLGGPVLDLRPAGPTAAPAWCPRRWTADECLFAAAPAAGRPLVEVDGVDPATWSRCWRGAGRGGAAAELVRQLRPRRRRGGVPPPGARGCRRGPGTMGNNWVSFGVR